MRLSGRQVAAALLLDAACGEPPEAWHPVVWIGTAVSAYERRALKLKDPRIVPEMGVRVSFLEQAAPQAEAKPQGVRVPAGAVVEREGASVAFVLGDENRVQQRTVQAGQAMGKDRQLLKGVNAGELVVVNPPDTLRDGTRVQQKQTQ